MLRRLSIPVQADLEEVEKMLASELTTGMERIDSIIQYVIQNGGKRIRPTVLILAGRMAGAQAKPLPRIAASIEMFHTASLLHDDVIDDAQMRRGKPSAKAKWGNQVSVLVGDLLFCRGSQILVDHGEPRLLQAMNTAISQTTEGELLETLHQNDAEVNADTYMKIIRGKTGALFALAAGAGAIIAGVEHSFEKALHLFGMELGQAFQLADDALDYVADEQRFGKTAGTDLREGKITYPLIIALAKAKVEERQVIRSAIISGHQTPERFGEVVSIIDRYGGIEETLALARSLAESAKSNLSCFRPSIERDALTSLASYAVDRSE